MWYNCWPQKNTSRMFLLYTLLESSHQTLLNKRKSLNIQNKKKYFWLAFWMLSVYKMHFNYFLLFMEFMYTCKINLIQKFYSKNQKSFPFSLLSHFPGNMKTMLRHVTPRAFSLCASVCLCLCRCVCILTYICTYRLNSNSLSVVLNLALVT